MKAFLILSILVIITAVVSFMMSEQANEPGSPRRPTIYPHPQEVENLEEFERVTPLPANPPQEQEP